MVLKPVRVFRFIFILYFYSNPLQSVSQSAIKTNVTKVEIIHAGSLKFDKNLGNGAKRLIGDVQFKQDNILMFCDSAYFYNNNSLDAFSRVHVQQGDSIHLHGDLLNYNGNTKKAIITKNVVLDKGDMQLFTDVLNYDMTTSIGYYTANAKIINKENVLTSNQGYYFGKTNDLSFKKNVVLINQPPGETAPQFIINCDTMRYNTSSKITYFNGPTTIKSKENLIYCEDGWYNTNKDLSRFSKNSYILTKEQKMFGDSLFYDRNKGIGKAIKNIQIIDTIQNITITGDIAIHYELKDLSVVTGNTLLTKINEKDTLYMHADTLKAFGNSKMIKNDTKNKNAKSDNWVKEKQKAEKDSVQKNQVIFAYHKVKIFKNDLQGKCDSLIYTSIDSTMKLIGTPTLWSEDNQLTADSINIRIGKESLKYVELIGTTFMVSQEDSLRYNQVRGKYMKGFFNKNELYRINVEGNGQTIYFAKDKEKIKAVNRADCSDLNIYLKDKKIKSITFITKPDATLYPLDKVDVKELKLKDFTWRNKQRPKTMKDIFVW
jgi:lipopolysaccharide export system protein LptA